MANKKKLYAKEQSFLEKTFATAVFDKESEDKDNR